ncbi:MAG: hypothetical protein KKH60_03255 [Proteobacteria bacterium]|nr:hypothetical protein [Pseudomonadota bacterium]MBU1139342.1 hypothetical protein [Pseudomonadota bacterium]
MKKSYRTMAVMATTTSLVLALSSAAVAGSGSPTVTELDRIVQEQQHQLSVQSGEIALLKEQLNALLGVTEKNKEALAAKVDKEEVEKLKLDKMVSSKNKNVDVTVYGQVNRAVLWADNGDVSKTYFVDNKNSSSRMGIAAKAKATDDLTLGGKLEYEIYSNFSNKVNQFEESTDASLDLRHADIYMESKAAGKLSLGHGSTASDGSAEMDLSGTKVVATSAAGDLAGGQYWYDASSGVAVYDTQVSKTIDNMDGLSRKDRIRYDTPSFGGFSLAASAIETGAYDTAARYERKFGDSTLAAALAWAAPGDLKKWDNQIDGSLSYLHGSGFNITFAGGQQSYDIEGKDDPTYWYGKLGYRAKLFSPGESAFSIDYGTWNDFSKNNDEVKSLGIAYVQNVKDWGTEFYVAYRLHELDRTNHDYDNVNALMAGARIKF